MAKKKNNPNNLMSFDFLPNMNQNVGGGLNAQLARLGQVQRMQPLVGIAQTRAFITPITKMMQDAQANIVQGMVQYNEANPDLDDSLLFDGTETILNTQLQENNVKFKELNRKLGFMSPTSKNYAETVKEINKINKSNLNLRDQNKKLLDIKNIIKDKDLQEISSGNSAAHLLMYQDIQQGKKDNFSTDAEGNLVWNNPNKQGEIKSIPISGIPADGPEMTQGAANDQAYNTFAALRQIRANELQPGDAYQRINAMAREIGDSGLKSLIFDNMNAANSPIGNTDTWWKTYAASVGVEPESEAGGKLLEQIKLKGMLHSVGGVKVKDHFLNWLKDEAVKAPKFGRGLPPPPPPGSTDSVINQRRPFGTTDNKSIFVDGKEFYKTFGERSNERETVMDVVQGKGGNRFAGAYGDYTWNPEKNIWTIGDEEISTYDLMTNEGIYKSGADFENNLFQQEKQKSFAQQLAVSDFSDMTNNANDVFNAINTAFKNKNAMTTGQDLKIERGGLGNNTITLTGPNGSEKKFAFNTTGGFMLDSRNKGRRDQGQLVLEDLIKTVNSFLGFDPLNPNK